MQNTSASLGEVVGNWPKWVQYPAISAASIVLAYYSTQIILILLGSPAVIFSDIRGLGLALAVLLPVSLLALATRKIFLVFGVVAALFATWITLTLLQGSPTVLGLTRQIFMYASLPMFSAVYLRLLDRSLESHRPA